MTKILSTACITAFAAPLKAATGKATDMTIVYGVLALLSVLLLISYILWERHRNKKFLLLFICVAIIDCGYFCQSLSTTLENALVSNAISYFGAAYAMLIMLFITADACRVSLGKKLCVLLTVISTAAFLLASSGSLGGLYYKQVSLEFTNGMAHLVKVYGPLHFLYGAYLLSYSALMGFFIFHARASKKIFSSKYAFFLLSAVLGNLCIWAVGQFVFVEFEFLAVSYIVTEILLLLAYGIIRDYECLQNTENLSGQALVFPENRSVAFDAEPPANMSDMLDDFTARLVTLSGAEKRIFSYYLDGHEIADIPDLAFISIHTVKKHNRSIYQKLGVSSRDELMLYIEFFRRCGRLSELEQ